jgi:hypothetical protein
VVGMTAKTAAPDVDAADTLGSGAVNVGSP